MQGNKSNPKSEVVDLNDTETVKVTKNIYYDIQISFNLAELNKTKVIKILK